MDNILVSAPPGVLKELKRINFNFDELKIIIVTHLHAEEYFDLPMILIHEFYRQREVPLIIIGPKELKRKTNQLLRKAIKMNVLRSLNVTFIDALRVQNTNLTGDYRFSFIEAKHANLNTSYAFMVKNDKSSLAYADTKISPGLSYLLKEVKNCIIKVGINNEQINFEEYQSLTENSLINFYPIGYPDELINKLKDIKNTKIINSNEQFYI